jgi:shikimate dehydrogenase
MSHERSHVVGLLGRGIGKSRSPAIHEAEARALGLPLAYRTIDFTALGLDDDALAATVRFCAGAGFSGCNVTFPFKQAVLGLCDSLSEAASAQGAVNTLVFRDGGIRGENTDWVGFTWLVEREFGDVAGSTVAQIGAGGAGSATAFALARLGAGRVRLYDPASDRARELARRLAPHFPLCRFEVVEHAAQAIDGSAGVVNATPVGMEAMPGMPFDPAAMVPGQWLADIIYYPLETQLVAQARARGHKATNGVSMVVGQAAEAFRLITGTMPDRERMLARLLGEIARETGVEQAA